MSRPQAENIIGVTREESRALDWLFGLMDAESSITARYKGDMLTAILREGVKVEYGINWNQVTQHLMPHLVLAIGRDTVRDKETYPFPMYALLPQTRMALALHEDASYRVEAAPTDARRYAREALNQLEVSARSLDTEKRREAMRLLTALKRVLRNG